MAATTIDELQVLITAETKQIKRALADVYKELDGVGRQAAKSTSVMGDAFSKVGNAATTALKVGVVGGIAAITASIPSAIRRIDTLNNSARTFENMGFKTEIADKAVKDLVASITGLPTPLDSAMRGMTALAVTYGDVDKGQKVFSALNNAILGFGGSAEMVDNALMQLSQLPMEGPLDAQTWNSLRDGGLTPVLVAMSKDMGISVNEMKEAFGSGELTVQDFTDRLIKMNKEGGGGLKSLEQIAKDSTSGIGTGFENMKTAIARGIAGVIESVGSKNISNAIANIGKAFEDALKTIGGFVDFIGRNKDVFGTLAASIATAIASIVAYNTYIKISTVLTVAFTAVTAYLTLVASLQAQGLGLLRAAWMALNIAMAANPIGLVITLVAALVAGIIYFVTQTETGREIFSKAMGAIKTAAEAAWNWIKNNWPLLLVILTGPIGVAVLAILKNLDTIKSIFSNTWDWIRNVWSAASGFFSGVAGGIRNAFSSIHGWLTGIFSGAVNGIKSIVSALVGWFSSVPDRIGSALGSVASKILAPFRAAFNGIASAWNNTVGRISFKAPSWVPGIGGKGFSVPDIPMLAKGGIVTAPTLAMIGEGGQSEAVIPLDKLEKMTGSNHIVVKIGEDTIIDRVVKGINNKSFMNNATVIEF